MNKFLAIETFARVAEMSGFTPAAAHLGMSVSAVTKTVARLESQLETQLFNRSTRHLALTEFGKNFYDRCVKILSDLEEAELSVREANAQPSGKVRMHLPVSFGRVTVLPALAEFYELYPGIILDLSFGDRRVDLILEKLDLAVQVGSLEDSGHTTRILTHGPQVTVASPAYLARHGTPKDPNELRQHNCIISRFGSDWMFRNQQGEHITVAVEGNLRSNSGDAVREATVSGLGISHGTWWLYRKDLLAGTVNRILQDYEAEGAPISIIYPANKYVPAKVRAVIDFMIDIIKGDQARNLDREGEHRQYAESVGM